MSFQITNNNNSNSGLRITGNSSGHFSVYTPDTTQQLSYISNGLVLYLDATNYAGSSNWLDITSNGNDAGLVQTPTYSSNEGGYFDLNGGSITATGQVDSFSITDDSTLDTMTSMSFEMWFNIDSIQGTTSPNMLFSKRAVNTNGYVAFFTTTAYTFRIGTTSPTQLSWSTTPTTGSWQQICITVGSGGGKVYRNGIEVQDSPSYVGNFGNINTAANLVIGDINPNNIGIFGFDGKISVVRMYNTILTPAEVLFNFDGTKARYGYL